MLAYLKNHGKDGHVKRGAFLGAADLLENLFAPDTPAPRIPESTQMSLDAIGGLAVVAETSNDKLAYVKREFVAAYARAWRLA